MRFINKIWTLCVIVNFFSACSFSSDEPKERDLKTGFKMELPGYLGLSDFDVKVLENLGNKVEPKWGSRFEAVVKPNVDLYVFDSKDQNGVTFVMLKTKQGKKIPVYGKYISVPYQGQWKHFVDVDGNPIQNLGDPIEQFKGRVIIRGSDEEQNYYTELKEKDRAFWSSINESEIKKNIKIYYENNGEWAGRYMLKAVKAIRMEKLSDSRVRAHTRYIWASPDGKEEGQDDRYFDLSYINGKWAVNRMGGHMSGRL